MKKLIKAGISLVPIFLIGHLYQNWPFVYGGIIELFLLAILFFPEIKK